MGVIFNREYGFYIFLFLVIGDLSGNETQGRLSCLQTLPVVEGPLLLFLFYCFVFFL